jgi:hypothetical protein
VTAIAKTVELIELREHLGAGFSARHASVELDDVAELACEWTAARELHPNVKVVIELQEIEARYRRPPSIWVFGDNPPGARFADFRKRST